MFKNKKIKNKDFIRKISAYCIIILIFVAIVPSINTYGDPLCIIIIGDYVWEDLNMDGLQDPDEPGIDDIIVKLYTCNGALKDTTMTSDGGFFEFIIYNTGNYYLKFILPLDYCFTLQDVGSDDTVDSDADLISGKTICINLEPGENDISWDAGMYLEDVSVGDYVWNDENKDGIQDLDESGVDGVTVELYTCDDDFVDLTVTSGGGFYEFVDFSPASYYVKFILPSDYVFTLQDQGGDDTVDSDADLISGKTNCIDLEPGVNDNSWDAGMYLEEFTLSIYIEGDCGRVEKYPDLDMYSHGTVVRLTAIANISAFTFSHWSGDLSGNNNPEYITMDSDKTVVAHFTFTEFTLTINIDGNGYIIKDPDQETYHFNDNVELTAICASGWTFSYWSGDLSGNNNPEYIQMYGDKIVTAHFTYNEYILTTNVNGNGKITINPDHNIFPDGTIVTLTAIADPGWIFDNWSGDLSGNNNPEYITMDENKTVTAHFKIAESPQKPTIEGPTELKANEEYTYIFKSVDPYNSDLYYYIDWGDGEFEEWSGPFPSGEKVIFSHTWSEKGTCTIKVKARNIYNSESEWGTLDVILPKIKNINISHLLRLINYPLISLILKILLQ